MKPSSVLMPVIHVIVPSASSPVTWSMRGPSAATRMGTSVTSGTLSWAFTRKNSPWNETCSPASRGFSTERYSRVYAACRVYDSPSMFSITILCESPMPRLNRPRAAA